MANKTNNPDGRPRRALEEIIKNEDPKWFTKAMKMAAKGCSLEEIYVYLGVSKSTMTYLRERDPEVQELVECWKLYAEAWFNKKGRVNLDNKEFSYQGFSLFMNNKFGWGKKDSVDINASGDDTPTININFVKTKTDD